MIEAATRLEDDMKKSCANCAGCTLGKLIAEGKLGANVDPQRFQAALARRRLLEGCRSEPLRTA